MDNFAAFILTHGRPDGVITYNALRRHGYTGQIYIVIDNEDSTADQYRSHFGDRVVMFDKAAVARTFDEADNFTDRRSIVYARNACFDIARKLGVRYFIQLDDDYHEFSYAFDGHGLFKQQGIKSLDAVWSAMLDFFKSSGATSIAMAQRGDFMGGKHGELARRRHLKRKAMNTFFCDAERPFQFWGRINEDVNTYVLGGSRGQLFLTVPLVAINQAITQDRSGGMTDIYLDGGTYRKSFYTVMMHPSSVHIRQIGNVHQRLHHNISWRNTVPCILHERHRK